MVDLVIGSGPAGVAVAAALLARGRRVVMIDGGKVLEPAGLARQLSLASLNPTDLTADDRAAWAAPQHGSQPGQVRRYGSDFAMEPEAATFADAGGVALRSSRATGGLSNLWGAAVLPYRQQDMAGWPITADDLAPHYRAVADLMPVTGRDDDLSPLFPACLTPLHPALAPSPQGGALLHRLEERREALAKTGCHVGAARVAVNSACHQCGLCLHGCPWNHIFSARSVLARFAGSALFDHRPGAVAHSFTEGADGVAVHLKGGGDVLGARLFIAAGVLETARILLASQPGTSELTLLDSQQAFLPMLHRWRSPAPPDQPPHTTLPQLFLEIDDRSVSPFTVHGQIYSWNDYYERDLMAGYGRKLPGTAPLWRMLSRRLMVAQLFLHSDHSARIGLRLSGDGRLIACVTQGTGAARVMQAAMARMAAAMGKGGMVALRIASRMGAAGASFHTGGTVPMATDPTAGHSDALGRPKGLSRVHLADASTFPSIPATTITFSAMANAHRIGTLAPE